MSHDKALEALRTENVRYRMMLDDALAVCRLPDLDNDGGPGDLAGEIRVILHNHTDAEQRWAKCRQRFTALLSAAKSARERLGDSLSGAKSAAWAKLDTAIREAEEE